MALRRCTRCTLPETHETIVFDAEGVCNICRQHEYKREKIDWEARGKDLSDLVESYRSRYDYDCIVPFSGGKDSTWTLYYLVTQFKLKPLVVRFDHGFLRPGLYENTTRVLRNLGVDFHSFTPNWHIVRKLMLQAFLEKGDFCWHCHTGIYSYPMWVALRYQVPLVFWGEPSAEYTSYFGYDQPEEVDEARFNRFVNLGITAEDMYVRLQGTVDKRELKPFSYPPLKDLRRLNYRSICLGSFVPWDVKRQSEIISRELGWKGDEVENVPPEYSYEKIECYMQGVRDYIKFIKRGYARTTHLSSIDIRNGRLSRDEAVRLVAQYDGKRPPSLDLFLSFVGLSEEEFIQIALGHSVSPYQHDPSTTVSGSKTHDFGSWCRDGGMPRKETIVQLQRWTKTRPASTVIPAPETIEVE
jgi:N-acetyl sugar amidotransferase